jgi:hypothetical protein
LNKLFSGETQTVVPSQFIGAGSDGKGLYYNPTTGTYYDSSGKTQGVNWNTDYSGSDTQVNPEAIDLFSGP